MASSRELTATEKLLDLIRGGSSSSPVAAEGGGAGPGPLVKEAPVGEATSAPSSAVHPYMPPGPGNQVAPIVVDPLSPDTVTAEPATTPESIASELVFSLDEFSFDSELASPAGATAAPPPLTVQAQPAPVSPILVLPEEGLSLERREEASEPVTPALASVAAAEVAAPGPSFPVASAPEPEPLPPEAAGPQSASPAPEEDDEDDQPLARPAAESTVVPSLESGIVIVPARPSLLTSAVRSLRPRVGRLKSQELANIAVDIQPGMIHLAKTTLGRQGPELLAYQSVPYDYDRASGPENLFEHQPFREVLFRALSEFVSGAGRQDIWCSYSFCRPVALANITIPKLPEAELANAVFWSAKRELEFDETASLFDFSVLQELDESGQPKLQTLVSLVPRHEASGVETMFKEAGFKLTGLTFPAAAIQNFLNADDTISTDEPVVYFTVRRASSFIDLFCRGRMFFSREIKTGADSFVESLLDQAAGQDIVIDEEMARGYLFPALAGQDTGGGELLSQVKIDNLKVVERLARQLARTFEYCGTNFKIPPVSRIVTSGEFTLRPDILAVIEARLGIRCSVIDPLSPSVFARTRQFSPGGVTSLQVAVGLSLSDRDRTANFLFTYADRQRETASRRVNNVIAIATICLTVLCGLTFAFEFKKELGQKAKIAAMQVELDRRCQAEPRSRTGDYVSQSIAKVMQFHQDNRARLNRFAAIAIVGELLRAVDRGVNLTDLSLDLTAAGRVKKTPAVKPATAGQKAKADGGTLTMAGYVASSSDTQEFVLMNLLKSLTRLSLLGEPALKTKEKAVFNQQEVLRFEIQMKTRPELAEVVSP